MDTFRFLKWEMYENAQQLFTAILKLTKKVPKEFRYEIGSQIIRSALSISLNIAEGCGKRSDKELNRFLEIALGSAYETLACTDTLRRNRFITQVEFEEIQKKIESIVKQIGGFKKKLDV